jgi:membrane protease YdiL (CAAX protease family)
MTEFTKSERRLEWKIRGKALGAAFFAIPLGGAWIIASGAYVEFRIGWAVTYGLALLGLFLLVHAWGAYRLGWQSAQLLRVPSFRALLYGLLCAGALLGVSVLSLLTSGASDADINQTAHDRIVLPILAVLLFPVVEEFAFRGWLQSNIERAVGAEVALIASAAAFAFVHSSGGFSQHFVSGLAFGVALLMSRSIWLSVFMHAIHNLGVAILDGSISAQSWAEALMRAPPQWMSVAAALAQIVVALAVVFLLITQVRKSKMA